ncbi:MAG: GntR family transcriptional regulator [Deltaproteobacteria bacterium]|jgi:GntR family transcriptional regulator|nr:GntR family transcriptional regulator [Deltaproteobacteria bacterium]
MTVEAFKLTRGPAGQKAYLRLADAIRLRILDGVYQPGERIPTETDLSQISGLSPLTVRQALGLLVDEGLLERFIGRGTFVRKLNWQKAAFTIEGLIQEISRPGAKVKVIKSEVRHASESLARTLELPPGHPVIYLKRTISSPQNVYLVQESQLKPDFRQPIMEAELEATYLAGIFNGGGRGLIKSADLTVCPKILSEEDASLLHKRPGDPAFELDYVFFGAQDPLAVGFFTIPKEVLRLSSVIGVRPQRPSRSERASEGGEAGL